MNTRDTSVDTIRGVAVFFMIASHTVWFLSNDKNIFWNFIRSLGDAVCFITFLFIYGITTYLTLFSKDYTAELKDKALKRIGKLLLAYYVIAFFGILKGLLENFDLTLLFKTLVFQNVPGFTEFLLPFILYSALFLIVRRFVDLRKLFQHKNSLLYLIIFGVGAWILGSMIAIGNTHLGHQSISPYIALLSGGYNLLRFPILQYMIVILLGLYFGFLISNQNNADSKIQEKLTNGFLVNGAIILLTAASILWASELFRNIAWANMFTRWPPSLLFVLSGLSFAFVILFLGRMYSIKTLNYFNQIGLQAILLLVCHIAALRLFEFFKIAKTNNGIVLTLYFMALVNIPLCIGLILRYRNQASHDKKLYNNK